MNVKTLARKTWKPWMGRLSTVLGVMFGAAFSVSASAFAFTVDANKGPTSPWYAWMTVTVFGIQSLTTTIGTIGLSAAGMPDRKVVASAPNSH